MSVRYILRSFTESPWIAASTVLLLGGSLSALTASTSAGRKGWEQETRQRWSLANELQRDPRDGIVPRTQSSGSAAPVRRAAPAQDAEALSAQHEQSQKEYQALRKAAGSK